MKNKLCGVFMGRTILNIGDSYYEVHLLRKGVVPEYDKGYIIGDYVYIFKGEIEGLEDVQEGCIYYTPDKVLTVGELVSDELKESHSISNIVELNIYQIFKDIEKNSENFTDAETIEAINNNSEVFTPTINKTDDFLKRLIKQAIVDKKISLKNYKDKFASQNDCNNMKSGLTHATKMSTSYFIKWLEVLGLKFRIVILDDGTDKLAPLPAPIEFDGSTEINGE